MSAIQLSFSLRVSSGVKTVHLLGSWDNYAGQLPLSKEKSSSRSWKGTFRFQNATLQPGQRYWYYYIIDGYHVAHNPSVDSTTEPTTGRELNILDVPSAKPDKSSSRHHKPSSQEHKSSSSSTKKSASKSASKSSKSSGRSSSRRRPSSRDDDNKAQSGRSPLVVGIPKGRPLSASQIQAPKPTSPHATKHILNAEYYDNEQIEELAARFGSAGLDETEEYTVFGLCPSPSSGSSLSYRSDSSSPRSSLSGYSTPSSDYGTCTCERYGITRRGERVKIDCGGSRCGYGDDSSDCSSHGGEEDNEALRGSYGDTRRHGIIMT